MVIMMMMMLMTKILTMMLVVLVLMRKADEEQHDSYDGSAPHEADACHTPAKNAIPKDKLF